ncbi:hypothetical protein KSF_002950 [Reticulibacter mediterranei]|uniref:HNH nuclease domain-containing protein n=1 Tax=Reticulibacter mediterranei TaxID=2778369 RepID=A0A8J3MXV9_9CHLR|nr:HNH endonuclease [Reticulibacter mediterranei]GHO90247.1 hypothetical protein KSF_002950 [Reticulibacter mediterranei]
MLAEQEQFLLHLAHVISQQERKVVSKIRERAGTEEMYLIFIREYDRVRGQIIRARYIRAEATLTLPEWLSILAYFQWRCAYCQNKPFQVMHHLIPRPQGGTSVDNCVPACYRCLKLKAPDDTCIQEYLATLKPRSHSCEHTLLHEETS